MPGGAIKRLKWAMQKKIFFSLYIIAALCLLPGIYGPLLLDDAMHLDPIKNWLSTHDDTFRLIFGNQSGPFGRPVSILSFVINGLTTGIVVWPMKLTNLILHFATSLFLCKLLEYLFKRDLGLAAHAKVASFTAACLWLVLPQHISTVFYVIQRMTILATLFSVIACWLYVLARERIERDEKNNRFVWIGAVFFTLMSVLSKETGLLVPLYFLLIELVYFRPLPTKPRPAILTWGFRLGVVFPCLLVAAFLAFNPGFVLEPYVNRDFSMAERAMTQLSVLADYFASTFIPMTRSAGVFNDDFPIAHFISLHEVMLLLVGAGLIAAAISMRKSYPSFSAGIGLFFIGHLLESSIFSLEIYFSHRNYMPSIGLVVAAYGLGGGLLNKYPAALGSLKRVLPFAYAALFFTYALASFSRASIWSDNTSLMTHALKYHPESTRLRSELLLDALNSKRLDIALHHADAAMRVSSDNEKRSAQLWRILSYCYLQVSVPRSELEAFNNIRAADRITLATSTALGYVSAAAEVNACPNLDRLQLGAIINQWALNTVQPPESTVVWKAHLSAAKLMASGGDLEAGLVQAQWAFKDSQYDFDAGVLSLQLAGSLSNNQLSKDILKKMLATRSQYTNAQKLQLDTLKHEPGLR